MQFRHRSNHHIPTVQWGKLVIGGSSWVNSPVSFPIAFSDTPLSVQVTVGGTWSDQINCSVYSVDKTTLQIHYRSDANHYAFWRAIGIWQWGTANTSNNWMTPIPLPISFSNTDYSIVLTITKQNGTPTDSIYRDSVGVKCKKTNEFYGGTSGSTSFSWFAVGY